MKHAVGALVLVASLFAAGGARAADDKVQLGYHAKQGQVARYKGEGTLKVSAAGQAMTIEEKQVEKVTITEVKADGSITRERETESEETSINGNKMPTRDAGKDKSTVTIGKTGLILAYKTTSEEKDEAHTDVRLMAATTLQYPDHPVGVGDKWTSEIKPNAEIGTRAGKTEYEVLGFEKAAGADCIKLKVSYHESEGSPALSVTGTAWVEKTSGDDVQSDYQLENLAMSMGPTSAMASGKMHTERASGGWLSGESKQEAKKDKTIDETVKDYEKLPGLFTLYRKKSDDGRETLYMEIREDQFDKLAMLEATAATGTSSSVVAGDPIDDLVFKFVRRADNRILMVVPNYNFQGPKNTPIERAIKRSYADAILEAYKIEAEQKDRKSVLINVSDLFRGDLSQISAKVNSGGGGIASLLGMRGGGYSMDRDKTWVAQLKNLPENIYAQTQFNFSRGGGGMSFGGDVLADPRSIPLTVDYNLFMLPENGYKPRLADPRVGYFLTEYQDYSNDSADDQHVRFIYRWNLEKQDPTAKLSPPKKPIVFWLDNAIPVEYRDAVRDGLLRWNKAFEGVGFKDAVVVKQMPDNADWDHADMRYNTIRWVTSPSNGYAVALFRVNPLTGQILNANITVDANLVRVMKLERTHIVSPASFFEDKPALQSINPLRCNMAQEAMEQAWFGGMALDFLRGAGVKLDEKAYINAFIKYVVSHEMGHIMGLRHNFVASTYRTMDQLGSPAANDGGLTASVMDYVAFNVAAIKHPSVDFWTSTVGPYDMWAIDYGYRPIESKTPTGELHVLRTIAEKCNEPGHAYESDEIADTIDPAVTRWDIGANPFAYWQKTLDVSRYLLFHLGEREPKKGESYYQFTRDFMRLLNVYASAAFEATRYVGGIHVNRNHRGDANEHPVNSPVDVQEQKKALEVLNNYVFAENAFSFPQSYYGKLTSDPFGGFDIQALLSGGSSMEFPVRDQVASLQRAALRRLFSGSVLSRLANTEYKVGDAKALTLPTLFHTVGETVWSELGAHRNIPTLRRQLQRSYLDTMIDMVVKQTGAPDDARMLAWDQLRTLKSRIAAARSAKSDEYTRVHLDESLMRINRALDARQTIGSAGGASPSLLQQLLGGADAQK